MNARQEPPPSIPPELFLAFAEKNLPPPAPMLFRTLAFLADGVLVLLAGTLALKFLLPVFSPDGFAAFADFMNQVSSAYDSALNAAVSGHGISSVGRFDAIVENASRNEALASFFETGYVISFVVAALYFVLTEQFMRGQTLGKKIFGVRTVIFGSARAPVFMQTLSRSFWKAASIVPAGLILTLLVIVNAHVTAFARRHRGWHDKLARTEVVDARRERGRTRN